MIRCASVLVHLPLLGFPWYFVFTQVPERIESQGDVDVIDFIALTLLLL